MKAKEKVVNFKSTNLTPQIPLSIKPNFQNMHNYIKKKDLTDDDPKFAALSNSKYGPEISDLLSNLLNHMKSPPKNREFPQKFP